MGTALIVELLSEQENKHIKRGPNYPTMATYGSSSFQGGEEGGYGGMGSSFSDKAIRLNFIRKVYSILMIALVCVPSIRRKTPHNMIFLGLFTLCEGWLIGAICSTYQVEEVLIAVGMTAGVVFALTLFAMQTKIDFTAWGGALLCILVVFCLAGFVALFFPQTRTVRLVFAIIGAIIFSLYIVFDTQMMMGGNHKYSLDPEEYVFAALNLYLDIINLFLYILQIIGASRD